MISAVLLRGIALPTLRALSLRLRTWPLQASLRSRTRRPLHHLLRSGARRPLYHLLGPGALRPLHHLLRSEALRPLHHLLQVRALRLLCLRLMPLGLPPLQRSQRVLGLRLSPLAMPALRLLALGRRALPLQDVSARLGQAVSSLEGLLGSRSRTLRRRAMTLRLLALGRRALPLQDVSARLGQGVSSLEAAAGLPRALTLRRRWPVLGFARPGPASGSPGQPERRRLARRRPCWR